MISKTVMAQKYSELRNMALEWEIQRYKKTISNLLLKLKQIWSKLKGGDWKSLKGQLDLYKSDCIRRILTRIQNLKLNANTE